MMIWIFGLFIACYQMCFGATYMYIALKDEPKDSSFKNGDPVEFVTLDAVPGCDSLYYSIVPITNITKTQINTYLDGNSTLYRKYKLKNSWLVAEGLNTTGVHDEKTYNFQTEIVDANNILLKD